MSAAGGEQQNSSLFCCQSARAFGKKPGRSAAFLERAPITGGSLRSCRPLAHTSSTQAAIHPRTSLSSGDTMFRASAVACIPARKAPATAPKAVKVSLLDFFARFLIDLKAKARSAPSVTPKPFAVKVQDNPDGEQLTLT